MSSVGKMRLPDISPGMDDRPGSARMSLEENQMWAQGCSDEIARVREQLREARLVGGSRGGPRPDALNEFKDQSPDQSHGGSPSRRSPTKSRWERGGGGGRGDAGGRGPSTVNGKPRWSIPNRPLSGKERLTEQEEQFQHAYSARQQEHPSDPQQRERDLKEAAMPWWERTHKNPLHEPGARSSVPRRMPYDPNRVLESSRDEYVDPARPKARPGGKAPKGSAFLPPNTVD